MNNIIRNTTAAFLLGCVSRAHGAPIDPAVIRQAVRETEQDAVRSERIDATGKQAGTRTALPQAAASPPEQNIQARPIGLPNEREQDSCLLNFGLNGTLRGHALSSHALGRTRVWRDQ